jgi:hypothetical protein
LAVPQQVVDLTADQNIHQCRHLSVLCRLFCVLCTCIYI